MLLAILVASLFVSNVISFDSLERKSRSILSKRQSANNPYPVHTINQPIDHFPDNPRYEPHTNSTFEQRYIFDASHYEPGGPVFLYIGGETSIESRLSNIEHGLLNILMEAFSGIGIILENRYYGDSYPFMTSTIDELAYLTTEQTIADIAFFARHARFPGVDTKVNPPHAPWILYGGSLAGAETAFSLVEYGSHKTGDLWGGIASSAPVHMQTVYPEWYYPIEQFAPGDCTASIFEIIDKMDHIVAENNTKAIQELKEIFGLGALEDLRDFAMTVAFPMGGPMNYPTNTWQEIIWGDNGSMDFWYFCQNVTNLNAPRNITAVDYQLAQYTHGQPWHNLGNYANYVKRVVLPLCETGDYNSSSDGCFGVSNYSFWAENANSGMRSYLYSTCTELGVYQVAEPSGPSLISRVLQKDYTQQWCRWAFPPGKHNSIPEDGPDLDYVNGYGGFNISAPRLALIDGEQDVWREVCYHARKAGSPRYSDVEGLHPEMIVSGAGHHWDSYGNGLENVPNEPQFVQNAHLWELRVVEVWLEQWKEWISKRDEL